MPGHTLESREIARLKLADVSPQDWISQHFRLYELTLSETADRRKIDNSMHDDEALRDAVYLANTVLDPVRRAFGAFKPNSVYRSQAVERALKNRPSSWISTSPHTEGRACDIEIVAKPTLELAHWASQNLETFDQIICECYDPRKGPNSGWVHVSVLPPGKGRNRRQLLSYVMDPASQRLVYVHGLQESFA